MAYDGTKPFDTGYLADAPEELRENFRALKEDRIVDAGALSGLSAGNAAGKIPISNGEVNQNLNADLLDGKDAADFAASVHAHASATTSSDGFLSAADKVKLDGIDAGAEENQNAFAGVAVGDVTISADSKSDTLTLEAGAGIELTADPENDKLTVTLGSHTHSYLPLSGGTMTGPITLIKSSETVTLAKGLSDDFEIDIQSGPGGGGRLALNGRNRTGYNGSFILQAQDEAGGYAFMGKPDGTLTWGGVDVLNPVGTVIAFAANSAPSGYLLCNGSAVSRTTYAALFAKIGTTYGAGDGSTTFNLPNLTDRFIQGSGTAGTVKSAGLPNISGGSPYAFLRGGPVSESSSGLMTLSSGSDAGIQVGGGNYISGSYLIFNAAKANAIYGNSDTVQPPALTMRYYIKY